MTAILGESAPVLTLVQRVARLAPTPLPILITGETGTGKEVVARAIHEASGRRGPFVAVDCGALTATLVESELFGHERGAFTGANTRKEGLVFAARAGTFFLDEIGELPLEAQTRLLRLLEGGRYRPVGATEERPADIRVVAATWRNLSEAVETGRFRRDLFHRLAVAEIPLPPLRARGGDVRILFDRFLETAAKEGRRATPSIDASFDTFLHRWSWPGNIRELKNLAMYLAALAGPRIRRDDLPPMYRDATTGPVAETGGPAVRTDLPYLEARRAWLDTFQLRYVEAQILAHGGNISAAARAAGMDRRSIQRVLARLGGSLPGEGGQPG